MKSGVKVMDAMTINPVMVHPDELLKDCSQKMGSSMSVLSSLKKKIECMASALSRILSEKRLRWARIR